MWDNEPERASGTCVACGVHTGDGIVAWLPRMSVADVRLILHADAAECVPREPAGTLRPARIGHSA